MPCLVGLCELTLLQWYCTWFGDVWEMCCWPLFETGDVVHLEYLLDLISRLKWCVVDLASACQSTDLCEKWWQPWVVSSTLPGLLELTQVAAFYMLEPCPFVLSDAGLFQLWTCHPPNLQKNQHYPAWAYFPNLWLALQVTVPHCMQPLCPDSSIQYGMNVPLNQRRVWPVFFVFPPGLNQVLPWPLSCCLQCCRFKSLGVNLLTWHLSSCS